MGSELTKEEIEDIAKLAESCRRTWTNHREKLIWDTAGEVKCIGRKEFEEMLVVKMKTEVIEYAVNQLPKEIEKKRRFEIEDYILDKKGIWFCFDSFLTINARKYWRKRKELRENGVQ